jgi:hypothetical protein
MKVTNNYGLPETITNVLARPQYSKGKANLSVTELMSSPRIVQLKLVDANQTVLGELSYRFGKPKVTDQRGVLQERAERFWPLVGMPDGCKQVGLSNSETTI